MKIKIEPNSLSFEELKMNLITQFPDIELMVRHNNFIVANRGMLVGCNIVLRRGKIIVAGNFPKPGQQTLFTIAVVLCGFLLPLIVYYATYHRKFKKFENEIGDFLKSKYEIS